MTKAQIQELQNNKEEILMNLDERIVNIFAEADINLTARRKDDIKILLSKIEDKTIIDILRAYEEATATLDEAIKKVETLTQDIIKEKQHCEELTKQARSYNECLENRLKDELGSDPKVLNAFLLAKQLCAITEGKKDREINAIEHIVCTYLGGTTNE